MLGAIFTRWITKSLRAIFIDSCASISSINPIFTHIRRDLSGRVCLLVSTYRIFLASNVSMPICSWNNVLFIPSFYLFFFHFLSLFSSCSQYISDAYEFNVIPEKKVTNIWTRFFYNSSYRMSIN